MKNNNALSAAVLVLSACFTSPTACVAQDGSLDLSFGTDGIVTTAIGSSNDYGYSVAVQSDGKLVVAGYSTLGASDDFSLVRYNTDGSLDTDFGSDGMVTTPVGPSSDWGRSVAIQSDGKIVVAGTMVKISGVFEFALVRYHTDGDLDTSFSDDGMVTTSVAAGNDAAYAVAIQSDGKILVAGYSDLITNTAFGLVRYNSDGSLDDSFDSDGKVTTAIGSSIDTAYDLAIQDDGKIVLAGTSYVGPNNNDFAVVRYNADGSLDSTFDDDGMVITSVGTNDDVAYSIVIQPDAKILVAGGTYFGTAAQDFALARYNSDGSLDSTSDADGKVITSIDDSKSVGFSAALQNDGKILLAGRTGNVFSDDVFTLIRYDTNGSLDTTFDFDGIVTTLIGNTDDYGYSLALQSDGKIVVAGWSMNGSSNYDFAIARYNNSVAVGTAETESQPAGISVHPNPFSTLTTLRPASVFHNATLTIYNPYGHPVKQLNHVTGNSVDIQRENLPSGLYYIQHTEGGKIISTCKLMIVD